LLHQREWALLGRLTAWLTPFKACFGHRAQQLSLREYVHGLLSDSPRKSMQAMLARVSEPRSYQAFHHFITHAPWDAGVVWRRLLAVLPERRGVLLLDDTAFLKQGRHSVGVTRQYASARQHVTNCQVAVTAALWAGARAWLVGAELYLPEAWLTPAARAAARIPATRRFAPKWRLAWTLVQRARAAQLQLDAVVADAGYGTVVALRTALDRAGVPYVMGITSDTIVFAGVPTVRPGRGPRRPRGTGIVETPVRPVRTLAEALPPRAWRWVTWRNGAQRAWRAQFAAVRVVPGALWRTHRRLDACWLLCERSRDHPSGFRFYFSNLPPGTPLARLARLAHQRWAIEQQYSDLKTELGLDHFEGRTWPGWQHHIVLGAIAYAFLQTERWRRPAVAITFPQIRAVVQEIVTGLLIASRPKYFAWFNAGRQYLEAHPLRI
jgi:SRSO17 transposase